MRQKGQNGAVGARSAVGCGEDEGERAQRGREHEKATGIKAVTSSVPSASDDLPFSLDAPRHARCSPEERDRARQPRPL